MNKFMDSVKTVTGYNAMHQTVMRDAFVHVAEDKYSWRFSPTLDRLETSALVGSLGMLGPLSPL